MANMPNDHALGCLVDAVEDSIDVGLVAVEQKIQIRIVVRYRATVWKFTETLDAAFESIEPSLRCLRLEGIDEAEDALKIKLCTL